MAMKSVTIRIDEELLEEAKKAYRRKIREAMWDDVENRGSAEKFYDELDKSSNNSLVIREALAYMVLTWSKKQS